MDHVRNNKQLYTLNFTIRVLCTLLTEHMGRGLSKNIFTHTRSQHHVDNYTLRYMFGDVKDGHTLRMT